MDTKQDELTPGQVLGEDEGRLRKRKSLLREYVEMILFIVTIGLLVRTFVVHAYRIPSGSMEDTLLIGDFLLANRFVYGAPVEIPFTGIVLGRLPAISSPQRGDVVIFASWHDSTEDFIKRCVGLPGDTILVRNNVLYVNGRDFSEILHERFGDDPSIYPRVKTLPYGRRFVGGMDPANYPASNEGHIVAPGHYFMMGDNRDASADSRIPGNGDVPFERLKARAIIIYFSLDATKPLWNIAGAVRWDRIGRLIH